MKQQNENEQDYTKFYPIKRSQSWEDIDILLQALEINKKDTVLSVISGGDNTLSFLTQNPKKVYAISSDIREIAYLEMKIVAYKNLDYEAFLEFVGIKPSDQRENLYAIKLRKFLSQKVQDYFDFNIDAISKGIAFFGNFEKNVKLFRKFGLPFIHNKKSIIKLLELEDSKEKEKYYNTVWNNKRWQFLFDKVFPASINFMKKMSDNPEFYDCTDTNLSQNILNRIKNVILKTNLSQNIYIQFILKGKYEIELPYIYKRENFDTIKQNLDKIEIVSDDLINFLKGNINNITKMNLVNIFEYMDINQIDEFYNNLINNGNKDTMLAYWNILPRKRFSEKYEANIEYKYKECAELYDKNKSILYNEFILEKLK